MVDLVHEEQHVVVGQVHGEEPGEEEDEVASEHALAEQVGESPGLPGGVIRRVGDEAR